MRPWAFGDVWDRMTPKQRRSATRSDWIVALLGAGLMAFLGWYLS
jgi:hypothetical protein